MTESREDERLRLLQSRIDRIKAASTAERSSRGSFSQGEMAWRMVIELVSGLLIGLGIGLGLDALFGTRPLFLVLFVMVGMAAGVKVMLQTARTMDAAQGSSSETRKNNVAQAAGNDAAGATRDEVAAAARNEGD